MQFLIDDWANGDKADLIGEKTIYVDYTSYYKYKVEDNILSRMEDPSSTNNHIEADTKIIFHVCKINENNPKQILIKASDSDIFIIMLSNMSNMLNNQNIVCMLLGVKNSCRLVNLTEVYNNLGLEICEALPGFHALTGCDYNPSFHRRAKIRSLSILFKNPAVQEALSNFKNLENLNVAEIEDDPNFIIIEEYVCKIYGLKSSKLNEARTEKFNDAFKNEESDDLFEKNLKGTRVATFHKVKQNSSNIF